MSLLQLPQGENAHLQATSYHLLKRMIAQLASNLLKEHTQKKDNYNNSGSEHITGAQPLEQSM